MGHIVEMSSDELANLQGLYGSYTEGFRSTPGSTVPISTIYKDAKTILDTHNDAAECAKKLRACGDKFASFFEAMDTEQIKAQRS